MTASLASTHEQRKNITYTFYRLYADTFLSNCYKLTFVSCVQRSGSFSCILAKSNLCFLFLSETRIVCEHRDFTFTNMSLDCRLTMICLPVRVSSWFWKFGSLDHWNNYVIILPMNFRSPITFTWKWRSMYKNPGSSQWWTSASTPCSQVDLWPSGRGHSSYSQLWTCKEYKAQTLNCFSSFNLKIPFKCMCLISVVYHLCYMKDKTLRAHTTCFTSSCFNNEIKFSSRLKWLIQHYPSILKQF